MEHELSWIRWYPTLPARDGAVGFVFYVPNMSECDLTSSTIMVFPFGEWPS